MITGGRAAVSFNPDPGYLFIPGSDDNSYNPTHVGELELSFRQPLLQGAGIAVNRAPIQISQVRSEQSAWEFKQAVMASVRSITVAYWDLHAARVALKSIDEVLPLLEEVVRLQEEAYKAEWTIYADVAKAYGQLHDYRQQRLDLQSEVVARELQLRHLLGLPPADGCNLIPSTPPLNGLPPIDPTDAVQQALINQPDLARQRLNVKIREVELFVAENGLLPRLDLRALYRLNGVGDDVGEALSQLSTAEYSDWLLGATFSVPLGRRQATAEPGRPNCPWLGKTPCCNKPRSACPTRWATICGGSTTRTRSTRRRSNNRRPPPTGSGGSPAVPKPQSRRRRPELAAAEPERLFGRLAVPHRRGHRAAAVLAKYNADLVHLEETKGTLLALFDIDLAYDPCRQLWKYGVPAVSPLNLESAPPPARLPPTAPRARPASPRLPTSPGQSRNHSSRRRRPNRTSRCPPRRCSPGPLTEACPRPSPPRLLRRNHSPPLKPRRRKCVIRCPRPPPPSLHPTVFRGRRVKIGVSWLRLTAVANGPRSGMSVKVHKDDDATTERHLRPRPTRARWALRLNNSVTRDITILA